MSARRGGGRDGRAAGRCPECGVGYEAGARRCEFCGKFLGPGEAPAPERVEAPRRPGGLVASVVAIGLVIGGFVYLGGRGLEREGTPAPAPAPLAGKRLAAAACEEHIAGIVAPPLRVIAFRSSLVAEGEGGVVVSGTVDLQSLAGELQRRRYWCRVSPGAAGGPAVEDGRLY